MITLWLVLIAVGAFWAWRRSRQLGSASRPMVTLMTTPAPRLRLHRTKMERL